MFPFNLLALRGVDRHQQQSGNCARVISQGRFDHIKITQFAGRIGKLLFNLNRFPEGKAALIGQQTNAAGLFSQHVLIVIGRQQGGFFDTKGLTEGPIGQLHSPFSIREPNQQGSRVQHGAQGALLFHQANFGLFAFGDVRVHPHPLADGSIGFQDGHTPHHHVAIFTIGAAQPMLNFVGLALLSGRLPSFLGIAAIVGVNGHQPTLAAVVRKGLAGEVGPVGHGFGHFSIGVGAPEGLAHGFHQAAIAFFALAQAIFGQDAGGDVGGNGQTANHVPLFVAKGGVLPLAKDDAAVAGAVVVAEPAATTTGHQIGNQGIDFGLFVFGQDSIERLIDHVFGGVAEEFGGGTVPGDDAPIGEPFNDGNRDALHQG